MKGPRQKHAAQRRTDALIDDLFRCLGQHACTADEAISALAYALASMVRSRPDAMVDVRRAFAAVQVPDIRRRA